MTDTERALLNAVCAAPGDDGPRLVYADWLDERGDGTDRERAEWIRLQMSNPDGEKDRPYGRLGVLLSVESVPAKILGWGPNWTWSGDEWNPTLKNWEGNRAEITFRRGFPDELRCTMDEFMGGACECQRFESGRERMSFQDSSTICTCHGAGRTPGLADTAARELWPVTGVVIADFRWRLLTDGTFQAMRIPGWDDDLMRLVYDAVGKGTEPAKAVSDACVRLIGERRKK